MLAMVNPRDRCIHHSLQPCRTITGRLASQNPNCQNIPRSGAGGFSASSNGGGKGTHGLRNVFVSRFGATAGVCVEVDYTQLEVVVLAVLSGDAESIKDLTRKVDFHCKRVTLMRPEWSYGQVVREAKVLKTPRFVEMRRRAKVFSFQRQYGAGARTIAENTGMEVETVKRLMAKENLVYSGNKRFYDAVRLSVKLNTPESLEEIAGGEKKCEDGEQNEKELLTQDNVGREGETIEKGNPLTRANRLCSQTNSSPEKDEKTTPPSLSSYSPQEGEFRLPTGTRFTFQTMDPKILRARGFHPQGDRNFSYTQLLNYPVQGLAGEIVQIMIGVLWRSVFLRNGNYQGAAFLTNTVHDCVWIDCRKEKVHEVVKDTERVLKSVREVMSGLFPEMKIPVDFHVETMVGPDMGRMVPVEQYGKEEQEEFR